jgi:alcohol dehydrogenase (cytochrome c)
MRGTLFLLVALSTAAAAQVTEAQLRRTPADPATWLMYGGEYRAWRYSTLAQIHTGNVARLAPKWIYQSGLPGRMQATPLIFGGMMYLTGHGNHAFALDLLTGKPVWRYAKAVPADAKGCCGTPNRGFAALGERLYKVNFQGTLVALDAKTGQVLWETEVASYKAGLSLTAAPLVVKDKVIVGMAGAEFGVRGFLDAYDAETGKRLWRFHTVPAPGEPGGDTWGPGDAWRRGGGSTWVTGSYDPELNLLYWGTGNPAPDMNGDSRPGDNLFTCSVVALDADTGQYRWHFQFTPHDLHDWDATEELPLVDLTVAGKPVKAVLQANRNGFFYTLDRVTGKLVAAKPYTKVTWASGLDANGRPILTPGQEPSERGTRTCPGLGGGHNWQPTAYSPQTGLYYFGSTDGCQMYYKTEGDYVEGQWYMLSTAGNLPGEEQTGSLIAVDPVTAETKWRVPLRNAPNGLLATAGGLVFTGDGDGYLVAFDARSGEIRWRFNTGGGIAAPPVTYTLRGKQYLALAAGASVITFGLPDE